MAIIAMKKLRLLGLKSEEEVILDKIGYTKCVEIKGTSEIGGLKSGAGSVERDGVAEKLLRLSSAVNLLEEAAKERKKIAKEEKEKGYGGGRKPLFAARGSVSFDDFSLITAREYEIFTYIEKLESLSAEISKIKSQASKLNNLTEQLKVYCNVEVPFSYFADTKNTCIMLGTVSSEYENAAAELKGEFPDAFFEFYSGGGSMCALAAVCHEDGFKAVSEKLSAWGFARASFDFNVTAKDKIKECQNEAGKLAEKKLEVLDEVLNFSSDLPEIKLLYDYYNLETIKFEAQEGFLESSQAFVLEGFVPLDKTDFVKDTVYSGTKSVVMEFSDTEEGDNPPTYTENNRYVSQYEAVTNMYSVPSPFEADPNMYVSVFYLIFFGIMLGDAGYGLILALAATILTRFAKMESGMKRIIAIIGFGGVSSLVWGALFGGWFGIDLNAAAKAGNAAAKFFLSLQWFSPMNDPLKMLALCLGLGVLQILFGLGIKAASLIKQGKIPDALMDVGIWYLFFAAVGIIAAGSFTGAAALSGLGKYMLIVSLVLLVLTQGRAQKGVFKKLFKGITSLYGIVGYISDILSYARLFGLGLASGVIGLVMNTIAGMLFANWFTVPFGLAILLGGHAFNIGINVLGAYIHDCRLQYIEFFSRFYTGGGHVFRPFGSGLKYYIVN